ncbi:unnamed protein product, partial [Prorocentrum cordatum]
MHNFISQTYPDINSQSLATSARQSSWSRFSRGSARTAISTSSGVVDLLAPSIMRLSRLSSMVEEIGTESKDTVEQVRRLTSEMDVVKERSELVLVFRERIEDFRQYCDVLEAKVNDSHSETSSRVQHCEDMCNAQKLNTVRIQKTADRTAQDLDVLENRLNKMVITVDEGLQRAHDHTDEESKRMEVCVK